MNGTPTPPPPAPTIRSKTLGVALVGIAGALSAAAGVYAETGSWEKTWPPFAVALGAALITTLRDTIFKAFNVQTEAVRENTRAVEEVKQVQEETRAAIEAPTVVEAKRPMTDEEIAQLRQQWMTERGQIGRTIDRLIDPKWDVMNARPRVGETWRDRDEPAAVTSDEGPL